MLTCAAQDRSGEAQAELAAARAQAAREVAAAQRAAGRAKAAAAELAEDLEAARDEAERAVAAHQARHSGLAAHACSHDSELSGRALRPGRHGTCWLARTKAVAHACACEPEELHPAWRA